MYRLSSIGAEGLTYSADLSNLFSNDQLPSWAQRLDDSNGVHMDIPTHLLRSSGVYLAGSSEVSSADEENESDVSGDRNSLHSVESPTASVIYSFDDAPIYEDANGIVHFSEDFHDDFEDSSGSSRGNSPTRAPAMIGSPTVLLPPRLRHLAMAADSDISDPGERFSPVESDGDLSNLSSTEGERDLDYDEVPLPPLLQPATEEQLMEVWPLDHSSFSVFMCPVTHDIMRDPVVSADGYTYERAAISKWFETSRKSPVTGQTLPHTDLVPNHSVRTLLKTLIDMTAPVTAPVPSISPRAASDRVTGPSPNKIAGRIHFNAAILAAQETPFSSGSEIPRLSDPIEACASASVTALAPSSSSSRQGFLLGQDAPDGTCLPRSQ